MKSWLIKHPKVFERIILETDAPHLRPKDLSDYDPCRAAKKHPQKNLSVYIGEKYVTDLRLSDSDTSMNLSTPKTAYAALNSISVLNTIGISTGSLEPERVSFAYENNCLVVKANYQYLSCYLQRLVRRSSGTPLNLIVYAMISLLSTVNIKKASVGQNSVAALNALRQQNDFTFFLLVNRASGSMEAYDEDINDILGSYRTARGAAYTYTEQSLSDSVGRNEKWREEIEKIKRELLHLKDEHNIKEMQLRRHQHNSGFYRQLSNSSLLNRQLVHPHNLARPPVQFALPHAPRLLSIRPLIQRFVFCGAIANRG
ncbi:unnamed protein product [Didymodactylos carnosus]|uniref:Uncharacterized protein n=1 Tax=Didymodactylos carnosus TaxID=1234261 RepID=A0A8S2DSX9_9BILA|nr:unnamed protein product [Didymodactylos carnosus]CAF3792997.1 unnamed protein product [Didymodactylos carnosus]